MSDPERDHAGDWDAHCGRQDACAGELLGFCHKCGCAVGDEDYEPREPESVHIAGLGYRWFCGACYQEDYMQPCGCCSDWTEKALIDPQTGECRECKAVLDEEERLKELV